MTELIEKKTASGLPYYTTAHGPDGFIFCFPGRRGGTSPAPYDSLNLGRRTDDDEQNTIANYRLLKEAFDKYIFFSAHQVHGDKLIEVVSDVERDNILPQLADGLLTALPQSAIGVLTADCFPVLIAAPDTGAMAAVHCGWRPTAADIAAKAVRKLVDDGAKPELLYAAIGAGIGPCCFEVGSEVVEIFAAKDYYDKQCLVGERHLDLQRLIANQLINAGVDRQQIETSPHCTRCRQDLYFSHRGSGGICGRQYSFIARQTFSDKK
jgi:purine-nucleoside/S-methyl-5'-thioadenosine phosphorylase / adenosine deaminase